MTDTPPAAPKCEAPDCITPHDRDVRLIQFRGGGWGRYHLGWGTKAWMCKRCRLRRFGQWRFAPRSD
jgi:hypothetical protein